MPIQLWLIIGFMTGSGGKIQTCVWVKTVGETSMPGFIQECCSWWMFARHSQAKLLVVWTHKHGTMCSYKEGRIEKRTEAGSEGLLHDCVSVCSAHCFSLCFVSRYSNHWLSHFSPVPFICPDRSAFVLRSSHTVCVSCGMISMYSPIFKFTSVSVRSHIWWHPCCLLPLVISCILLSNNFSAPKLFLKKTLMLRMMLVAIQWSVLLSSVAGHVSQSCRCSNDKTSNSSAPTLD